MSVSITWLRKSGTKRTADGHRPVVPAQLLEPHTARPSARFQRSKLAIEVIRRTPSGRPGSSPSPYRKLFGEQTTPVRTSHSSSRRVQWNWSESLKNTMVRSWPSCCGCTSSTEIDSTNDICPTSAVSTRVASSHSRMRFDPAGGGQDSLRLQLRAIVEG